MLTHSNTDQIWKYGITLRGCVGEGCFKWRGGGGGGAVTKAFLTDKTPARKLCWASSRQHKKLRRKARMRWQWEATNILSALTFWIPVSVGVHLHRGHVLFGLFYRCCTLPCSRERNNLMGQRKKGAYTPTYSIYKITTYRFSREPPGTERHRESRSLWAYLKQEKKLKPKDRGGNVMSWKFEYWGSVILNRKWK